MITEHDSQVARMTFLDELAPQSAAYYDALLRSLDAALAGGPPRQPSEQQPVNNEGRAQ